MAIVRFLTLFIFLCAVSLAAGCSLSSSDTDAESPEESSAEAVSEAPAAEPASTETSASSDSSESDSDAAAAEEEPAAPAAETEAVSSVEILWQVPGEAVEKYYLRYGVKEDALDKSVTIPVRELDKIDHPDYGPLFRYLISGVPAEKTIYFTIQAENQYGLSPESPVQKVESQ